MINLSQKFKVNIFKHLISTRAMAILLLLFAIAIGIATFIENSYDTITAKVVIYNAWWFELILLLLVINFSYNIKRYGLLSRKKITMLLIHLGFIIVILGAGITRYIGFEGVMIIKEGEAVNYIYSSEPYLQVKVHDEVKQFKGDKKLYFTPITSNDFNFNIDFLGKKEINISYHDYVYHAQKKITSSKEGGKILELTLPGKQKEYLREGDVFTDGIFPISFNNNSRTDAIQFYQNEKGSYIIAPYDMLRVNMSNLSKEDRADPSNIAMDSLSRDIQHPFYFRDLINVQGVQIVVNAIHDDAKIEFFSTENDSLPDALIANVNVGGYSKKAIMYGGAGRMPTPTMIQVGGLFFQLGYGAKMIELPFDISLADFRLVKYPGSESPSSFESDIVINDSVNKHNKKHQLFMNNVVDYGGYRFFQSGYDWSSNELKAKNADPDVTNLSVNHDFWGTWTSYLGYFILFLGFIGTLTNKSSRFLKVRKQVIKIRKHRLNAWLIMPLMLMGNVFAQYQKPVDSTHAEKFGDLEIQTESGDILKANELSKTIFKEITNKDSYFLEDGTRFNHLQLFIDYIIDPEFWSKQKIIFIDSDSLALDLGISGKYASIDDFFHEDTKEEKLFTKHQQSLNNEQKSAYDIELINAYSSVRKLYDLMFFELNIYPFPYDLENRWVNWNDIAASKPIAGKQHGLSNVTFRNILINYFSDLKIAKDSADYSAANTMLDIILTYQKVKSKYVDFPEFSPVSLAHADKFGHLLVQSFEGRIEPIHTLAYDLFHKVSRKDKFKLKDGTQVDAIQVLLDFLIYPEYWKNEKIIYQKRGSKVFDHFNIDGKYASYNDINAHILEFIEEYNRSFEKKDIEKNVFDKELIKVFERFKLLDQLMNGYILKVYPIKNDPNNLWVNEDSLENYPQYSSNDIYISDTLKRYLYEVKLAAATKNYNAADKLINKLSVYQKENSSSDILPTETLIDLEIYYNKSNIFGILKNIYGLLAVFLLIFSFIDALIRNRKSIFFKFSNVVLWVLIGMLMLAFIYHTFGLGLRWYITGHAPWSNGYEALTFIAWGGVLAGFIFIRNSKITLAATALLAFFVLMTAGHSSFDPQMTPLQPVLKSYWLMIHVACITISYGFLGLGFILGLINLFTYLGKTFKNENRLNGVITELTYINEMTLTIGLVLATIGTFLGGIWANESWGRYWGWDAKETWALVIVLTYAIILHFRLIPGMRGRYIFNVASVIGFSSVLMTFVGVNYYLSKGLHSYARGDTPVFPMWAWITIGLVFLLITIVGLKEKKRKQKQVDLPS